MIGPKMQAQAFLSLAILSITFVMPAAAQTGSLKLKISPSRAGVFVNGKYLGPAGHFAVGSKYALDPGEHEVKLVDPRYEELTTKVTIASGKTTVLRETLKPKDLITPPFGLLRVKHSNPKAGVFLNGAFYAFVDEIDNFAQGLRLKPGEYDLKVVPPGGSEFSEKVKIEADKTTLVRAGN